MMKRTNWSIIGVSLAFILGQQATAHAMTADEVKVKQAIADTMTPEELAAYKERVAAYFTQHPPNPSVIFNSPGDICTAATYETGSLPYGPIADTTVGAADNFDLNGPSQDASAPTCIAAPTCTGGVASSSGPRGAIFTGTGTGPDRAWKIRTNTNCTLTITMDPTGGEDLGLIVYQPTCSSLLSDCACVDDTGAGGVAESVTLDAVAGTDYFIVVDGYSLGAIPPGPSGPYTLQVTGAGCNLVSPPPADLAIMKTDGVAIAVPGSSVTYTIIASNATGPNAVIDATVADTFPATLSCTWTCSGLSGGTCAASGSGNINDATVDLPVGASVTYTATCTLSASATGALVNTATVAVPVEISDPTPGNNSATDTDGICAATLAPPNQVVVPSGGAANTVGVTMPTGCGWTAASSVPWMTVDSGSPGNGNGTVSYTVGVNAGPNPRRGTMTIAAKPFIVSQKTPVPAPCTISASTAATLVPVGGSTARSVAIEASTASCVWSAKSHVGWITLTSATTGSGDATVPYSVAANTTGIPRKGRITVNGKRVTISQN
jgi:uncharacterized repeat protein (TIGR01451 family)